MSTHSTLENDFIKLHTLGYEDEIPEDILNDSGMSYVAQGSSLFRLKNTSLYSALIPSDEKLDNIVKKYFNGFQYDNDSVHLIHEGWHENPFPLEEFRYVMRYFQEIYDREQTEAGVLLLYNNQSKDWKVLFVLQTDRSGGFVKYIYPVRSADNVDDYQDKKALEWILNTPQLAGLHEGICDTYDELYNEGYRILGTIHSHCNFNAFHSGTDDADEKDFEGLHITIGNVRSGWSFSSRFMIGRVPFPVDITEILGVENITQVTDDIDSIQLEDTHLKYIIPDVPRPRAANHKTIHNGPINVVHNKGKNNNNNNNNNNNKYQYIWDWQDEIVIPHENSDSIEKIYEDEAVRLYDVIEKRSLWVNWTEWTNNRDYYDQFCVSLPEPPTKIHDFSDTVQKEIEKLVGTIEQENSEPTPSDNDHNVLGIGGEDTGLVILSHQSTGYDESLFARFSKKVRRIARKL